jgi:hypothetical protein
MSPPNKRPPLSGSTSSTIYPVLSSISNLRVSAPYLSGSFPVAMGQDCSRYYPVKRDPEPPLPGPDPSYPSGTLDRAGFQDGVPPVLQLARRTACSLPNCSRRVAFEGLTDTNDSIAGFAVGFRQGCPRLHGHLDLPRVRDHVYKVPSNTLFRKVDPRGVQSLHRARNNGLLFSCWKHQFHVQLTET